MPCQFWMKDGKLVIDSNGSPILSNDCPCGECCERLLDWMVSEMTKTYTACVNCEYGDEEICGDCQIESDLSPTGYIDGKLVKRSVNPLLVYGQQEGGCNNGFFISSQPADGNDYKDGEIITLTACEREFEVPYLNEHALPSPLECRDPDVGCMQFVKVFCKQGDDILYPIIPAPDFPGPPTFSNPSTICNQTYWSHCFEPVPVKYAKCAVQILAPRYMFDDVVTTGEPDMTKVWGVAACWCEGNDKWEFKKYCGGNSGKGLIVVDAPFTAEYTDKVDEQGNPILDENDQPIQVLKCEITCEGQKALIEEMLNHYDQTTDHNDGFMFRATRDPNEWEEWTGETPEYTSCFWGYLPLGAVYGYVCDHEDDQGVDHAYNHYIIFDCDCNMTEMETPHTGTLDPTEEGFFESDKDLCTDPCPVIWAMKGYAEAMNMQTSPVTDWTDDPDFDPLLPDWDLWGPHRSGDGGVIIQEDYRAPGQNIYSIGGTPCVFAAWDDTMLLWVDCECNSHVDCISNGSKKFLRSVDPCICVDWRELVDDNPQLFGIVDKEWGSHTIVSFYGGSGSSAYTGPYWVYGATVTTGCSNNCSRCEIGVDNVSISWSAVFDPFIDYNMLVVHRSVNGINEIGHVNKGGGISNYRVQSNNSPSVSFGQIGITDGFGRDQRHPLLGQNPVDLCKRFQYSGYAGWYINASCYHVIAEPYDQPECSCDPGQDYLPICKDHSMIQQTDTIRCSSYSSTCIPHGEGDLFIDLKTYKNFVAGHEVYVTNQTSCEDICVRWEPGRWEYGLFGCCVLRTSCGLMVKQTLDPTTDATIHGDFVLESVHIPSFSELDTMWSGYFTRHGYYNGVYGDGNYPSGGGSIDPAHYTEVRNQRGTLLSYQATNVPSGIQVKDVQPPLCHTTRCASEDKSIYTTLRDYCDSYPVGASTPCDCIDEATETSGCVLPSD